MKLKSKWKMFLIRNIEMNEKHNLKWIGNGIGDEGAKSLSESLKINSTLTILNLSSNVIE